MDADSVKDALQTLEATTDNKYEMENEIIEQINSPECAEAFATVIQYDDISIFVELEACLLLEKCIKKYWDESDPEIKKYLIQIIFPMNFIHKRSFSRLIDLFDYCMKNSNPDTMSDILENCVENTLSSMPDNDDEIINWLKMIRALVKLVDQYFFKFDADMVDGFMTAVADYINIEAWNDPTKCRALQVSLDVMTRLSFSCYMKRKMEVDGEIPEEIQEAFESCLEITLEIVSLFEEQTEFTKEQVDLIKATMKLVCLFAKTAYDKENELTELILNIEPVIANCFMTAANYTEDKALLTLILKVAYFMRSKVFPIEILEVFSQLISIKQNDLEEFMIQPQVFLGNNYYPSLDVYGDVRNNILSYVKSYADNFEEEEILSVLTDFEPTESNAMIVSRLAKECKTDTLKSALVEFALKFIESASEELDNIASFYLLSSIHYLFDENFHKQFIQSYIPGLSSCSIVYADIFIKYLTKIMSTIPELLNPGETIPFILPYASTFGTYHALDLLTSFCRGSPEICSEVACIVPEIASQAIAVLDDDLDCDDDNITICTINFTVYFISNVVDECDDSIGGEEVFHLFETLLDPRAEPIEQLLRIARTCIQKGSQFSQDYLECMLQKLTTHQGLFIFMGDFTPALTAAIIANPDNAVPIYEAMMAICVSESLDKLDRYYCIGIITSCILMNEEFDASSALEVVDNFVSKDGIYQIVCMNLLAAIIATRDYEISLKLLYMWMEFLNNRLLCCSRDVYLHRMALEAAVSVIGDQSEFIQEMDNPDDFIHPNIKMKNMEMLTEICVSLPIFPEE